MKKEKNKFKEFFKPTKVKIVLAIIIFLLFPIKMWNGILPERCLPEEINCTPMKVVFWAPLILHIINFQYNDFNSLIFPLAINLIMSYLLSCLLILIYNKVKKR